MTIVHEAVCDGCGKREPARNADPRHWEVMSHPAGWLLLVASALDTIDGVPDVVRSYCSAHCVGLNRTA